MSCLWLIANFFTSVTGFSLSSGSAVLGWSGADGLSPSMQGLSKLLHDSWVDTQIVVPQFSSGASRQNNTAGNNVDAFGNKFLVLEGGLPYEGWRQCNSSSARVVTEELHIEAKDITSASLRDEHAMEKLALETKAVLLSISVQNSCMESGAFWNRRCWRNLAKNPHSEIRGSFRTLAPVSIKFTEPQNGRAAFSSKPSLAVARRELAPVTFSFPEPQSARAVFTPNSRQEQHRSIRGPLVSSLRQFRLEA